MFCLSERKIFNCVLLSRSARFQLTGETRIILNGRLRLTLHDFCHWVRAGNPKFAVANSMLFAFSFQREKTIFIKNQIHDGWCWIRRSWEENLIFFSQGKGSTRDSRCSAPKITRLWFVANNCIMKIFEKRNGRRWRFCQATAGRCEMFNTVLSNFVYSWKRGKNKTKIKSKS